MKKMRDNHGVTMVALVVTILVLTILAVSFNVSMTYSTELKKYNKIKEDIIALTEEVKVYYVKNASLPVYTDTTINLNTYGIPTDDINSNDSGNYYPIDISALPGDLTLNCGQGNKDKNFATDDLYVMNESSLTVYYLRGALLNNVKHYTIIDDFSGGSLANKYYSKVDLPIISVVTMESDGKDASLACAGDTVTLRVLSNYNFTTLPTVKINNEEVTMNWNNRIGIATYKLPSTEDSTEYGAPIPISISGYVADGRNGEEITEVNFGKTVYRYAESLVTAFKNGDLKIGDYVNYQNPTTGEYVSTESNNGEANQTYSVNNNGTTVNWRVLGLSEDGNHLLLTTGRPLKKEQGATAAADYNPYYYLKGATGMVNFIGELDNICGIYKNNYADSVKSLTIDDINRLCGVTVDITNHKVYKASGTTQTNIDKLGNIGTTQSYTGQYASPQDYLNGTTSSFSKTSDAYYYAGSDAITSSSALYDVLFTNTDTNYYWLASSAAYVASGECHFGPERVDGGEAGSDSYHIFYSNGVEYSQHAAVRPVVTLKSDVKYGEIVKIDSQTEETW